MEQKKYMDIARVKEENTDFELAKVMGFESSDIIVIQEKIDGANAAVRYDETTGKLVAFSRKNDLAFDKTLNGFWKENELIYVKTFYVGPFISWDHCRTFVGQSDIAADLGEGVVVKNQTKLNDPTSRTPFVLKIVGEHFKEVKWSNHIARLEDPQRLAERAKAMEIAEMIITTRRVEKELYKMRDEGILPDKLEPEQMRLAAQNLPKRIYQDCLKEEPESVVPCGEHFGKICAIVAMRHARKIIIEEE